MPFALSPLKTAKRYKKAESKTKQSRPFSKKENKGIFSKAEFALSNISYFFFLSNQCEKKKNN
jgi:hypothetical protein